MSYYPQQPQYVQGQQGQQAQHPSQGQPLQQYSQGPSQGYPTHQGAPSQQSFPPPPNQQPQQTQSTGRGYHQAQPQSGGPSPAPPQSYYPPPPPAGHQQHPPAIPASSRAAQNTTAPSSSSDHGSFQGGNYAITHRDTNTILTVELAQGATVKSEPGAMIHMSGTVQLTGTSNWSMKKLLSGGERHESHYTGPGRVTLGPTLSGDVIALRVGPNERWQVGKDAYLARTMDVVKESKRQGLSKALFSGEDLFVYHVSGNGGFIWLKSFGAVERIDLKPGEQHVVDNGHLVAWNCEYKIESAGGGFTTSRRTGEGLVCRFTGPGAVYIQTRNQDAFESYVTAIAQGSSG